VNALLKEDGKIVGVGWREKSGPKKATARVRNFTIAAIILLMS